MMSTKRKIRLLSTLLVLVLACSSLTPYAQATNISANPSDAVVAMEGFTEVWEVPGVYDDPTVTTYRNNYGERYESRIVATSYDSVTTDPDGQLPQGWSFPVAGGAIYVNQNEGHIISLSLSASWGEIPISIGVGYAYEAPGVAGIIVNIPASTSRYRVSLIHHYEVNRVEYKHYKYNELLETFYMDNPVLQGVDGVAYRV